ncbi:MAG: trigger factor [Kiritimatiellae bacterium]|nr:trigger factor [Kiritimatiellia bacterium]
MTFEKKESSPCVMALSIKVDAEEVKPVYKKVMGMFLREASLPGFRKGKVPLAIIKQKFQQEITRECEQECFREFYPKALEQAEIAAINLQNVTDPLFSQETGFSCTALVEVKPDFELPKYKKLAIKEGDTKVTDEQVTERLESFRKAFAKFEDAKEGDVIADGDFVQIDYAGALDAKGKTPLAEVIPEQKAVCSGTGFWTQLEEGRFRPEILEALKGMKAGETKDDIKVKFPKDNAPEAIKGKKCVYTVTVKAFRRRTLPDDKAFVEAAKVESLDVLRTQFREQMEKDAKAMELEGRKNQAIELLLKKADFAVPPSLVARQTQSNLQELAQRAQGMSAEYIEQNRDKILADAEADATRQVRLSYILLGIAKEEKIEASDADVTAGLEKIAGNSNGQVTVDDLRKQLAGQGQEALYREQIRAEKALDLVLAEAK